MHTANLRSLWTNKKIDRIRIIFWKPFFKLRQGALIPRSVGPSVGLSVGRSVLQKITKKLQNFKKPYKTSQELKITFGRPSRELRQYAGASLTESSFFHAKHTNFLTLPANFLGCNKDEAKNEKDTKDTKEEDDLNNEDDPKNEDKPKNSKYQVANIKY